MKIVSIFDGDGLFVWSSRSVDPHRHPRGDGPFTRPEAFQLNEGLVGVIAFNHRIHPNLLHEPHFIGADRVELIYHVITVARGRRIAQRTERVQSSYSLLPDIRLHILRLIDDHKWIRGLDK